MCRFQILNVQMIDIDIIHSAKKSLHICPLILYGLSKINSDGFLVFMNFLILYFIPLFNFLFNFRY